MREDGGAQLTVVTEPLHKLYRVSVRVLYPRDEEPVEPDRRR
jgi:hypothetical protein